MMWAFDKSFYFVRTEPNWYGSISRPTVDGVNLLIRYLHDKYQTNICHVIKQYEIVDEDGHLEPSFLEKPWEDGYQWITPYIQKARRQPGSSRTGFIIWIGSRHAIFMAYLREGEKECILYSDSLGGYPGNLQDLYALTAIPVYVTPFPRQSDDYSCVTDAIVFARDITGKDRLTGEYLIPHLPEILESRKQDVAFTGLARVQLPEVLLKTAQKSSFIRANGADESTIIHKGQSLSEFHARYRITEGGSAGSSIYGYLLTKGRKYDCVVQIQHYLTAMESFAQHPLTSEQKKEFISKARYLLGQDSDEKEAALAKFSEDYIHSISFFSGTQRPQSPSSISSSCKAAMITGAAEVLHAMPEDVLLLQLSQKHNLVHDEWILYINTITCALNELYVTKESQYGLFERIDLKRRFTQQLISHPMALAAMDYLLIRHGLKLIDALNFFSRIAETAARLSKSDFCCLNLLIQHPCWINMLLKNNKLFVFGNSDAYYAIKILECYPELLSSEEKEVLRWTAEFKAYESHYSTFFSEPQNEAYAASSISSNASVEHAR